MIELLSQLKNIDFEKLSDDQKEQINNLIMPRMVDEYFVEAPFMIQQLALCLNSRELLFGGAVGGGKSSFALMCALQYVDVPGYSALILRRTWNELNTNDGILTRFSEWMADKNVKKKDGGRTWVFPSGARIQFGYINTVARKTIYQGSAYQTIIFDEAALFEREIYEYLLSRCRGPILKCVICRVELQRYVLDGNKVVFRHVKPKPGQKICDVPTPNPLQLNQYGPAPDGLTIFDIPYRIRSTANPGGPGHQFLKERFIDPSTKIKDGVFIPSTLYDNPYMNVEEYLKNLGEMGPIDRARMINGDWEVRETGNLFNRGDLQFVDKAPDPADVRTKVRFWDMAASDGDRSDYTVGALCSITHDGRWFVEDIKRIQALPQDVEKVVRQTAVRDGIDVRIWAEQEPGSSGKALISHYKRTVLAGYRFDGVRSTGSKTARAGAVVSQASGHNLFIVNASWKQDLIDEMVLFDKGPHDDQVDAISGAFLSMTGAKKPVRLIV